MNFTEITKKLLSVELNSKGFKFVCGCESCVIFESSQKQLSITHDVERYTHEIDIKLGLKEESDNFIKLSEVVRFRQSYRIAPFQTSYPLDIPMGIKSIYKVLLEELPNWEKINSKELSSLIAQKEAFHKKEMQQYIDGSTRRTGNAAWESKNFQTVVEAYKSIKEGLTKSESFRLKYAKSKLSKKPQIKE